MNTDDFDSKFVASLIVTIVVGVAREVLRFYERRARRRGHLRTRRSDTDVRTRRTDLKVRTRREDLEEENGRDD